MLPEQQLKNKNTLLRNNATTLRSFFFQWEWMLLIIFIGINIMNIRISSNYLNLDNIMNVMIIFLDKAIMVYGMMMVLLLGEIDISIASILTLSATCAGVAFEGGLPLVVAIFIALAVGVACGAFNGFLLVKFPELNSTIVTLGNMILFRGIAYMLLEDDSLKGYAKQLSFLAWNRVMGIPISLVVFLLETIIFAYIIHRSKFGRKLYAMGTNITASYFSGIKTSSIKFWVYVISGLLAAIAGLFLVGKLGSVRANIARGYEMEVIAMAVLGGVSTAGGKGRVIGVVLGVFTIGLLRYGLGLVNISSQILMIIIGGLLIISVAIPNIKEVLTDSKEKRRIKKYAKS